MSEFRVATTEIRPGLSVIEASAGTGKTHTITHLVPRLLLEGTVDKLEHILLVTYTNDAAGELAERVRLVLEKLHAPAVSGEAEKDVDLHAIRLAHEDNIREVIGRALLDIDRLNVSTIHSFCLRTLQEEGALCGLPVMPELVPDISESVESAVRDLWDKKIAKDERLASHALAGDWKIAQDLELALMAAGRDDLDFAPVPRDLQETLEAIEHFCQRVQASDIDALRALMARVPENFWNLSAGGESERRKYAGDLSPETPVADWLKAAQWAAQLGLPKGGLINARSGKALIAEAAALEAVKIAADAVALAADVKWAWQAHCAREATRSARARMEADRQITYDGLISRVRDALVEGPRRRDLAQRLRQRYKVALVDESQDTDPRQFEIFRTVFLGAPGDDVAGSHRLVLVGDPKQAIYAFRGADLSTYLKAREEAPQDHVFTLSRTFRAPPELVRATNAVFAREGSFLNPGIRMQPATAGRPRRDVFLDEGAGADSPRIEVWLVDDSDAGPYEDAVNRRKNLAKGVAAKIARLLEIRAEIVELEEGERTARRVGPGDFAVLVNSHFEAEAVRDALRAAGVPSVTAGGADIMGSEEAADLIAILRALAEPRLKKLRFAALATRLLGRSASELREIARTEDAMLDVFARWGKILAADGVAAALAAIDAEERVSERLAAMPGGERRLSNLRQLTDVLQSEFEFFGNHAGRMLRWAAKEAEDARGDARTGVEERQQQLESDARAVKIATMHSAKGLEFPLVFCPFLWNRGEKKSGETFCSFTPEPGVSQLVHLKTCDAETKAAMSKARFEERLRLAYVAMTRARVKLWVHAGAVAEEGGKSVSALDWLLRRDGETSLEDLAKALDGTGRGQLQKAGLAELIKAGDAGGVLADCGAPSLQDARWGGDAGDRALLAEALPAPELPPVWTMTSFSALTREKNAKGGDTPPEPGEENDAGAEKSAPANGFLDAPAGALVGTAIHDWIETWDFSPPDAELVKGHLERYALAKPKEGASWAERVVSMLDEVRGSLLPGFGCSLAAACPDPAASEWHFQLPLDSAISPKKLADIFARHGQEEYASMLEALPEAELLGYLHGFIDRIAVDPRTRSWGVIDWKTNKLGTSADAHRRESSLLRCAMRSHYFLQMHLYLVALRRYLGHALAPDDAWLVFLRGVRGGSADGILHIKPRQALLEDLGSLFRTVQP